MDLEQIYSKAQTEQEPTRRDFFKKSLAGIVGLSAFASLGSGLLVPKTAYAEEQNMVYSHFLCDSIENNPEFRKLRLREGSYSLEEVKDELLKQAVIVKGEKGPKNITYSVGDRFKLVFFQMRFPKDSVIIPEVNGARFPEYKTKGNDWEYNVWPLKASEPGQYKILFYVQAPKHFSIGNDSQNRERLLKTGIKFDVGVMLDGSATFGSP